MTDNTKLDAIIQSAQIATMDAHPRTIVARNTVVSKHQRTYARALIAKLIEGMEGTKCKAISPYLTLEAAADIGHNAALTEIRRRAGLPD